MKRRLFKTGDKVKCIKPDNKVRRRIDPDRIYEVSGVSRNPSLLALKGVDGIFGSRRFILAKTNHLPDELFTI